MSTVYVQYDRFGIIQLVKVYCVYYSRNFLLFNSKMLCLLCIVELESWVDKNPTKVFKKGYFATYTMTDADEMAAVKY